MSTIPEYITYLASNDPYIPVVSPTMSVPVDQSYEWTWGKDKYLIIWIVVRNSRVLTDNAAFIIDMEGMEKVKPSLRIHTANISGNTNIAADILFVKTTADKQSAKFPLGRDNITFIGGIEITGFTDLYTNYWSKSITVNESEDKTTVENGTLYLAIQISECYTQTQDNMSFDPSNKIVRNSGLKVRSRTAAASKSCIFIGEETFRAYNTSMYIANGCNAYALIKISDVPLPPPPVPKNTGMKKFPDNRLIVNGVDLTEKFKMVLVDGYTLTPPSIKSNTLEIPGGNGVIDLSYALTGDSLYGNRKMDFDMYIIDVDNYEKVKTEVSNFLHGKTFDYKITMDPDYIYRGKFEVASYTHKMYQQGKVATLKISINAEPFKRKPTVIREVDACGGIEVPLLSGRKPVKPTFTIKNDCKFIFNGIEYKSNNYQELDFGIETQVNANDIVLKEGMNTVYICSHKVRNISWREIRRKGITFKEFGDRKIFEWYRNGVIDGNTNDIVKIMYEWYDL